MARAAQGDRALGDASGNPSQSRHTSRRRPVIQSAAPSLGVELTPVSARDASEIESAVTRFAGLPNGGLIVTSSGLANVHHDPIIALAARHRLPAVYFHRLFAPRGGLICYGPDSIDPTCARRGTSISSSKGRNPPTSLCRCRRGDRIKQQFFAVRIVANGTKRISMWL
jgi:hypothetical protein